MASKLDAVVIVALITGAVSIVGVIFRENGAKPDAGIDNLFLMEEIMNEMRKDLGLRKVKKGNLLAFFVNDIKKVIKAKNDILLIGIIILWQQKISKNKLSKDKDHYSKKGNSCLFIKYEIEQTLRKNSLRVC